MSCLVFYIDKTASHKHIGNSRERLTAWKDSDDIVAEGQTLIYVVSIRKGAALRTV